jgi:hypothetical protein
MTVDEVIDVFVSGMILVIGLFVMATIAAPGIADLLDSVIVQVVSALAYGMVLAVIAAIVLKAVTE